MADGGQVDNEIIYLFKISFIHRLEYCLYLSTYAKISGFRLNRLPPPTITSPFSFVESYNYTLTRT